MFHTRLSNQIDIPDPCHAVIVEYTDLRGQVEQPFINQVTASHESTEPYFSVPSLSAPTTNQMCSTLSLAGR